MSGCSLHPLYLLLSPLYPIMRPTQCYSTVCKPMLMPARTFPPPYHVSSFSPFFLSGCCMAPRCRCPGGRSSVSYKWWKCRNKRWMKIPPKQQLHHLLFFSQLHYCFWHEKSLTGINSNMHGSWQSILSFAGSLVTEFSYSRFRMGSTRHVFCRNECCSNVRRAVIF